MAITVEELAFEAKLREYIDRQIAQWDEDERKGRLSSQQELDDRMLWEDMVEGAEWDPL